VNRPKKSNSAGKAGVVASCACLASMTFGASSANAGESPDQLNDPFHVSIGTYVVSSEPSIQLNGETTTGDNVNFDEVLGGGDASRVRLDADWRFGDSTRHKLRLVGFSMSRDNKKTIDEQIDWGDVTYPVNAELKAEFKFSVIELAYEYAFLRRDNYELGGSIGLHYAGIDASLKAERTATGEVINRSNDASVDLPLPVIGLRGLWKLPYNFYVDAQGQYFALAIDEYDGNVQDYRLMLTWQPKSWLGLGIGYNSFKVDVDVEKDKFNGSLAWKYDGPMIFYSASF